jgi:hypothetical protein
MFRLRKKPNPPPGVYEDELLNDPDRYGRRTLLRMTENALRRGKSEDEWEHIVRQIFPHLIEIAGERGFEACLAIARRGIRGDRKRW